MTLFSDLVDVRASTVNPTRLVLTQKDAERTLHVRIQHPGVVEYQNASGQGNTASGDLGWYLNAKKGREALYLDMGGDARSVIQVREAGVKSAPWLDVDGWQELVGATRLTGNPAAIRLF